jgi:hypothetical protein
MNNHMPISYFRVQVDACVVYGRDRNAAYLQHHVIEVKGKNRHSNLQSSLVFHTIFHDL